MKDYKQIDFTSVEETIKVAIGGMKFKDIRTSQMVAIIEGKKFT